MVRVAELSVFVVRVVLDVLCEIDVSELVVSVAEVTVVEVSVLLVSVVLDCVLEVTVSVLVTVTEVLVTVV